MTISRQPAVLAFGGLIVFLVPLLIFLLDVYASFNQNRPVSALNVPIPTSSFIMQELRKKIPLEKGIALKLVYRPIPMPESGILSVYHVKRAGAVLYRLVLFGHDIVCSTCKDLVAAALYDAQRKTLAQVMLLEPWEIRGEKINTESFLAQFAGQPAGGTFVLGKRY